MKRRGVGVYDVETLPDRLLRFREADYDRNLPLQPSSWPFGPVMWRRTAAHERYAAERRRAFGVPMPRELWRALRDESRRRWPIFRGD